jgi:cell division transport system permease protein
MIAHVAWRLSRRAAVNLWRAPLPSLVSVLTISLSLFIGASFVLGLFAARSLLTSWGAQASVTLYLDRQTTDAQARALAQRVLALSSDVDVAYVDRGLALKRLRADLGDLAGALDGLSQNPLPPSLEVTPRVTLPPAGVRVLAAQLGQLPGVSEVDYGREWLDKLEALARGLRLFGAGALLTVLGAALLVVANTIRLAVYARRDEIEIMKLVGATDGYVRAPFLLEGALQGLIGAALALGAVLAVQRWLLPRAAQAFAFASGISAPDLSLAQLAGVLGVGAVVGLFGSWLAVARFLRT